MTRAVASRESGTDTGERETRHGRRPAGVEGAGPASLSPLPGRMLQRSGCACGGGCPRCGGDRSRAGSYVVNTPGDRYEQEADQMAERVMRAAGPHDMDLPGPTPRPTGLQRACAACQGEAKDEEEQIQRKEAGDGGSARHAPVIVDQVLRSSGGPLDGATRSFMESRFSRDFGGVRVHTDELAADSAAAVSARAYTVGSNVVFGRGEYRPGTEEGRRLLAHELAHVVQQRGAPAVMLQRSVVPASDPGEPVPFGERPQEPLRAPDPHVPEQQAPRANPKPEKCEPPAMVCTPSTEDPTDVLQSIRFPRDSAKLDAAQKAAISALVAKLHAGGPVRLRVDGYASAEGECAYNWELSCRRAQEIFVELTHPSDRSKGLPSQDVDIYAHGESDAAGPALAPNRNGLISLTPKPRRRPRPRSPWGHDLPWSADPWPTPGPTPGPSPSTPSTPGCVLPVRVGAGARTPSCATGPDFLHHDRPTVSGLSDAAMTAWALTHRSLSRHGVSDVDCEVEMNRVLSMLAGAEGRAAAARFFAGTGGIVSHGTSSTLGAMALRSGSFAATLALVKTSIEAQFAAMSAAGYGIDPCRLAVTVPETHFGALDGLTLKAVIGGTQGETLFATSFSGSSALRSYSIGLRFVICDDFGVDETDLYAPGLIPFWILQHERSATLYRPFVNELELNVKISGTF